MNDRKKTMSREHIDRCIELYGQPLDEEFTEETKRSHFEQMRADLMIAVGMLMALESAEPEGRD